MTTAGFCDAPPFPGFDPGVFQISGAVGVAASACANINFTIATVDAASGELSFTPATPYLLGSADGQNGPLECAITFSVKVLKVPTVNADDVPGKTLGTALATFQPTGSELTQDAAGSTSALVTGPNLSITKTANPKTINAGQTAQFTIVVDNTTGTGDATNVVLRDTLTNFGKTWTLNPAVPGCSLSTGNPQVLSCDTLTVPKASSVSLVLQAPTDNAACPGNLTNQVSLTAPMVSPSAR